MPRLSKIGAAALAAFGWTSGGAAGVTASYLVVAGGAGGGSSLWASTTNGAGGGGAGGLLANTTTLNPTLSYTVTVGAGGAGSTSVNVNGSSGTNSILSAITALGGGGGGSQSNVNPFIMGSGQTGGSGGGGCGAQVGNTAGGAGTGTSGQGYNGGAGLSQDPNRPAGGGGGSSGAGVSGSGSNGGNGGIATLSSISGTATYYAGGGGGGVSGGTAGLGGGTATTANKGGAGDGAVATANGGAATANTGGGGGGSAGAGSGTGGNGGSGIVIISYPAPQKFGGGVVTTSGSNVIHTFTTSGTLTPISSLSASYLIVAGGGAGGPLDGGGGGAGGMQTGSGVTIDTNSVYVVTVGAGGAGATYPSSGGASPANSGSNSLFSAYVTASVGGGGGGSMTSSFSVPQNGGTGGSGGGASYGAGAVGGSGTSGQGNAGGNNNGPAAGGGGGAGAAGGNGVSITQGGAGGNGLQSSISGTATYYAGGGGGAADPSSTTQALGGLGGGGNSAYSRANNGTAGTANTGGGGGGGVGGSGLTGYSGGSGIVIISYAGSQQMAGGTVTNVGGNTIHTFTSSGYLTPLKLVPNSLRFRGSNSAYFNRTPASAGNTTTWTWSAWIKRGSLTTEQHIFEAYPGGSGSNMQFFFDASTNVIYYKDNGITYFVTSQAFRDPASWYHFVITWDTTNGTAANRLRFYVNGSQVTAFSSSANPSSSQASTINTVTPHYLSRYNGASSGYVDGYMAEINFIDGQALTPTSFGGYNSYGVWQPATYGGSYGTNGFYLPFTNKTSTTTLGYDFSPNGNNWTTNNISLTAGSTYDSMTDVPTLTSATAANYCVINPLDVTGISGRTIGGTISDANLTWSTTSSSLCRLTTFRSFTNNSKWYAEVKVSSLATGAQSIAGVMANGGGNYLARIPADVAASAGDIVNIAYDPASGKIWYGLNNTYVGLGNPSAGTNPFYTLTGTELDGAVLAVGTNSITGGTTTFNINCGQQPFVYTPPSGFVALNTYNI